MEREGAEVLLAERSRLRAKRDYAAADAIRAQLLAAGWEVVDRPDGSDLHQVEPPLPARQVTLLTIVHGWTDDVARWLTSMVGNHAGHDFEVLMVDNSGDSSVSAWLAERRGERVRTLELSPSGFGTAVNAGLEAAVGEMVVLFDPGVEAHGDVVSPLLAALGDPDVVAAGPFGLRLEGKEFVVDPGPEVQALEGYCLAFRRQQGLEAGGFDAKFRFYRIADIEFTFRLRANGGRAGVVPVPLERHAHRLWEATDPEERARLSRKNFYRFLDRWRDQVHHHHHP